MLGLKPIKCNKPVNHEYKEIYQSGKSDGIREYITPKIPMLEGDGYDNNGNLIYDIWICPKCDKKYEIEYEEYKFCPNCGQAIDWNGVEFE